MSLNTCEYGTNWKIDIVAKRRGKKAARVRSLRTQHFCEPASVFGVELERDGRVSVDKRG